MRFPDVQALAYTYFTAELTGVRVATKVPADLDTVAATGFIRVTRGPGTDDKITDSPLLDVEAFHTSDSAAWELAEDARQAAHALAGKAVNGALVDSVTTATAPVVIDYGNPKVTRVVASYRLNLRKITP